MKHYLKAVSRAKQEGATAIEYALIAGIVVLVIAVALSLLATDLSSVFNNVGDTVTGGGN
ncbi:MULTISPECIES: Flp family type IVb pilin [Hydrocarboniphaga]|jgi:pilus assembly protein Flp/PilA|uniref:Flp/Fap pilin component n=1 Tax=Hydrocarboniphaga effusa AP103 TaxID=1172194 RepID=I8HZW5_9GAMM|nr:MULTISPECIES: Flp family type IVb pilin [Hydrocarboniphaga]EIT69206.1 hypothetical protein WQQ_27880 [Hydrocarboniphaga effusa AP103]MDZ4078052.1 Flp family type IVb pilin [Hydrocarboniphaga sp.]